MQNQIKLTTSLAVVSLGLFFNQHTRPQKESLRGTVVVAAVSQNKAAIAADSRVTEPDGRYMDSDCKISKFGNEIIFASAGLRHSLVVTGQSGFDTYDSHDMAHLAFTSIFATGAEVNRESVKAMASEWGDLIVEFSSKLALPDPDPPTFFRDFFDTTGLTPPFIGAGFFAGVDHDGQITVVSCQVSVKQFNPTLAPIVVAETQTIEPGHPIMFSVLGRTAIAEEFLHRDTPRSKEGFAQLERTLVGKSLEDATSLWAKQLVQWTILYGTTQGVGGPIDMITIGRSGINWIGKKAECKANE